MYHSITIGQKNTWTDWKLIPKSRPHVAPPEFKSSYVEIPGGQGSLDLSTALSGQPLYKNRTGNWDFYTNPDFKTWTELYSEIMNAVHGQYCTVILEDDPLFYYVGRITVSNWQTERSRSVISFSYNLQPFKYLVNGSMRNWAWDSFNLEEGIIKEYNNITIDGTKTVTVIGSPVESYPIITTSTGGMTVTKNGISATLNQGENRVTAFTIQNGSNSLTFTGTGTVSIDFDGRSL